jgi:hypothetical protein
MQAVKRGVAALVTAVSIAIGAGTTAQAAADIQALTPWDAQIYSAAFQAARSGDYAAAAEKLASTKDKTLAGHVEFLRIMAPNGPKVSYEELAAWLSSYADHPGADRVYSLALKRKPEGAADPEAPALPSRPRTYASMTAALPSQPKPYASLTNSDDRRGYTPTAESRQAREAFYSGDPRTAHALASAAGDRWVAGLSAFRLGDYVDALRRFESLARDPGEGTVAPLGSGVLGVPLGDRQRIPGAGARLPADGGALAAHLLRPDRRAAAGAQVGSLGRGQPQSVARNRRPGRLDTPGRWDRPDRAGRLHAQRRTRQAGGGAGAAGPRGRRGQRDACGTSVGQDRRGEAQVDDAGAQHRNAGRGRREHANGARREPGRLPHAAAGPQGGFSLDKALVYAIVRQESRFNADATSHAGARGLMQLMPRTAAYIAKDSGVRHDSEALRDPGINLKLGQDYFKYLTSNLSPQGDLLRAVAAYNGGPGAVMRAVETVGNDYDPLMIIESLPAQETRDYVEKVVSGILDLSPHLRRRLQDAGRGGVRRALGGPEARPVEAAPLAGAPGGEVGSVIDVREGLRRAAGPSTRCTSASVCGDDQRTPGKATRRARRALSASSQKPPSSAGPTTTPCCCSA